MGTHRLGRQFFFSAGKKILVPHFCVTTVVQPHFRPLRHICFLCADRLACAREPSLSPTGERDVHAVVPRPGAPEPRDVQRHPLPRPPQPPPLGLPRPVRPLPPAPPPSSSPSSPPPPATTAALGDTRGSAAHWRRECILQPKGFAIKTSATLVGEREPQDLCSAVRGCAGAPRRGCGRRTRGCSRPMTRSSSASATPPSPAASRSTPPPGSGIPFLWSLLNGWISPPPLPGSFGRYPKGGKRPGHLSSPVCVPAPLPLPPVFERHTHPPIQIAGGNLHFNKAIIAFLVNGHTRLLPWPLPYGFAAPPPTPPHTPHAPRAGAPLYSSPRPVSLARTAFQCVPSPSRPGAVD